MATTTENNSRGADLRSSPLRGIKPLCASPMTLRVEDLEEDPTNPGAVTASLRYKRREPSIRDSYDILGTIVYPLIVCQHDDEAKRVRGLHIVIDGHGRLHQANERGQETIEAFVYPAMDLERRICLRQTLGAAQEGFDPASVIADLRLLAGARNLDIQNPSHVKTLIRDLPAKVQQRERDLLTLARWDSEMVGKVGEASTAGAGTIGLDKVKGLTGIVDEVKKHHPVLYASLGGDKGLTKKLGTMYLEQKFSQGTRSQEAIRRVKAGIAELSENNPTVQSFFDHELPYQTIAQFAPAKQTRKNDLVAACEALVQILVKADPSSLGDDELRILRRTNLQINGILEEVESIKTGGDPVQDL